MDDGEVNDTHEHAGGCVISLFRAECNKYGTGPTQRSPGTSRNPEYPLKHPAQQGGWGWMECVTSLLVRVS